MSYPGSAADGFASGVDMALSTHCIFRRGFSPIIAAAVHNGHDTRPQVERNLHLNDTERLREEDPVTSEWTQIAKTQIVGLRSRFEVDLNRPRGKAVYRTPEDAWGLDVWERPPDEALVRKSLEEYDEFYASVQELLVELIEKHGRVVIYDLHTYNHRRGGETQPIADPLENPEVNIGTGTMDRRFWGPVVDRFIGELRAYDFHGRSLDVRENVRFQGGYFGKWVHQTFPEKVCAIAVEVKKFFMNEWTGQVNLQEVDSVYGALAATVPAVLEELERM